MHVGVAAAQKWLFSTFNVLSKQGSWPFSLLCTFQPNLRNVFLSDTVNMSILEIVVLFVFYELMSSKWLLVLSAQCSVSSAVLSQRHCVMDSRLTYHLLELMLLRILLMLICPLLLISRISHNSIHYAMSITPQSQYLYSPPQPSSPWSSRPGEERGEQLDSEKRKWLHV